MTYEGITSAADRVAENAFLRLVARFAMIVAPIIVAIGLWAGGKYLDFVTERLLATAVRTEVAIAKADESAGMVRELAQTMELRVRTVEAGLAARAPIVERFLSAERDLLNLRVETNRRLGSIEDKIDVLTQQRVFTPFSQPREPP